MSNSAFQPAMMNDDRTFLHEEHSPDTSVHYMHSPVDDKSPRLPQTISHRGYKGKFPENTLRAIEGAIQAGTHALELDLRLSRDGVVVLSHDATLQRCFGIKKKVKECDWAYLKTIHTLEAPHEPMARLVDVLEFMRQPGREHISIVLDIKRSDDADIVMRRIAETIESVPIPAAGPDWHQRVMLGCWSALYLPLHARYLPRYPMMLICFDLGYARQFLRVPGISFSVNQMVLMGPLGGGFLEEARAARRRVYLWTVNSPSLMRWAVRHKVEGVITDEPARFRKLCMEWEKEQTNEAGAFHDPELDRLTISERLRILTVAMFLLLFGWFLRRKYFPSVERVQFEQRKVR